MFDYGIYTIVVKNLEKEGLKSIHTAKNMMINSLKLQFDPKNIKYGLNLSQCSTPTAYLYFYKSNIVIQDCNMSFASTLMISKARLKNSSFQKLVPDCLQLELHKIFKRQALTDKVNEFTIFLNQRGTDMLGFNMSLKTIKLSEEKKYFAVQLTKNKHVYKHGLAIELKSEGVCSSN
jgi:hypothetical protein